MRTISANMQSEITAGRVCRAVKITLSDATTFGFTQHDKSLSLGGVTYNPLPGDWEPPIRSRVGTSVDNQSFAGTWENLGQNEQDLIDGAYDDATIEALIIGWNLSPVEGFVIFKGVLGDLSFDRDGFAFDAMDGLRDLSKNVGSSLQPGCNVVLGSALCGVTLSSYQVSGTITSVSNARLSFTDSALTQGAAYFTDGIVTFTSGNLNGQSFTVESHATGGVITLQLPTIADIAVSDTFTITPGCSKTTSDCSTKFANLDNYQGFPYVRPESQVMGESPG